MKIFCFSAAIIVAICAYSVVATPPLADRGRGAQVLRLAELYGGDVVDALFAEAGKCNLESAKLIADHINSINKLTRDIAHGVFIRRVASNCPFNIPDMAGLNVRDPETKLGLVSVALLFGHRELADLLVAKHARLPASSPLEKKILDCYDSGSQLDASDLEYPRDRHTFIGFALALLKAPRGEGTLLPYAKKSGEFLDMFMAAKFQVPINTERYLLLNDIRGAFIRDPSSMQILSRMTQARCTDIDFQGIWRFLPAFSNNAEYFKTCIPFIADTQTQLSLFRFLVADHEARLAKMRDVSARLNSLQEFMSKPLEFTKQDWLTLKHASQMPSYLDATLYMLEANKFASQTDEKPKLMSALVAIISEWHSDLKLLNIGSVAELATLVSKLSQQFQNGHSKMSAIATQTEQMIIDLVNKGPQLVRLYSYLQMAFAERSLGVFKYLWISKGARDVRGNIYAHAKDRLSKLEAKSETLTLKQKHVMLTIQTILSMMTQ